MFKLKKKYSYLLKITLIIFIFFLIAATVTGLFFRSTARNIGYYLSTGRRNTAIILITEYLGNPPSKLKARILSNFYGLAFEYYDNDRLKWTVGKKSDLGGGVYRGRNSNFLNPMNHMKNEPLESMHRMMRGVFKRDIYLSNGRFISIYFPVYPHRKVFLFPILLILFVVLFIASILFFMIRKTLLPIQKLIDASRRIGGGDLSYRLTYNKSDEFSNVVYAFNKMAEKLEGMLKSQRELLHMISHELRTPLTRINLALELEDFEESRKVIRDETREINELIESIMELSRLENDEIGDERCDLVEIVEKIVDRYNGINFKIREFTSAAYVKGKKILLEKAVGNIIDNAVKYSDANKPIIIELRKESSHIVCKVINSGKGIEKDEIDRIFNPFFRAKNAITESKEGKGLGLVVAKRVIDGIGGSITCKSSPEGPTMFILKIPICENSLKK